jgi:hypothetical protein
MTESYTPGTVVTFALTTADIGQPATYEMLTLGEVNVHVYGSDVFYGSGISVGNATQSSVTPTCSIVRANAVVWFQKCYVRSMFFKSYVNATPGYVVVTGTVM